MKYNECKSYKRHGLPNHRLNGYVHGFKVEESFDTFSQLVAWLDEHELHDEKYFNDEESAIYLEHDWSMRAIEEDPSWVARLAEINDMFCVESGVSEDTEETMREDASRYL